jgi:hypothetical protein
MMMLWSQALLLGHLIVDFRWLTNSIEANRLLQPYSYEVRDPIVVDMFACCILTLWCAVLE